MGKGLGFIALIIAAVRVIGARTKFANELARSAPVIGTILCCFLTPHMARCQSDAGLPVPEFYGIYAVSNGRLVKLEGKEVRTDRTASVRMGQRQAVGGVLNGAPVASSQTVNLPVFAADLKIIVFSQSGGMVSPLQVAEPLRIEPLVFIRNLSVDTGFPNNVRRSGPENGWEYGNAPELLGLATGDHPEALELLKKPFPGQKDMIIAGFAEKLSPGVYRFTLEPGEDLPGMGGGRYFTFAVEPIAEAENSKCADASVTYAMMVSNAKYRPCPAATARAALENSEAGSTCSTEATCMRTGDDALRKSAWGTSLAAYRKAAELSKDGTPWFYVGRVELLVSPADVASAWDKALSSGASLPIPICRGSILKGCDSGTLTLSPKTISLWFGRKEEFTVALGDVASVKITEHKLESFASIDIQVGGKKYSLDPIPLGVQCNWGAHATCGEDGMEQQRAVAGYVARTISKLANGGLGTANPQQ